VDDDLVLLERWRAGDNPAGEDLFRRHFSGVLRFFDNKVWGNAEDLTQQTFLECVKGRDRFRGDSTFRTYLFGIAWNQLRRFLRDAVRDEHVDFEGSSISALIAKTTSPSGKLDRAENGRLIHRALARLPLAQQTLLECHYWQELDATALSEIFDVPPGAIRVRLMRARNALREELERLKGRGPQTDDDSDVMTATLTRLAVEDSEAAEGG
jgi:RNA polymerase sigma factor (sigma-70 family)